MPLLLLLLVVVLGKLSFQAIEMLEVESFAWSGQMMLKIWAWIYRRTGWYSPWARVVEYKYLQTEWADIQYQFLNPDNDLCLDDLVAIKIGCWQCEHGFARRINRRKWRR